jgi:hypothetical protein
MDPSALDLGRKMSRTCSHERCWGKSRSFLLNRPHNQTRLVESLSGQRVSAYRTIFEVITLDARYQRNLDWGEARSGHPEGTVRAHIAELERNLDGLRPRLSDDDYWRLRILIHTHDSFKGEAKRGVPIIHPSSHASLACKFLSEFCNDPDLLAMVQYHDERFALWRQFEGTGQYDQERFAALLENIHEWSLFLAFNIVDGCTEGKEREALCWFFDQVAGKVESRFTKADILLKAQK